MPKTGVIGIGSMGKNHARVYSEISDLVGICDKDKSAGKKLAQRYSTKYFENVDDMIDSGVEALSIATPTVTHYSVAKKAIEAGIHVLIEKPICANVDDAQDLIKLAKSNKVVLAVGQIERHNPSTLYTKEALDSGEFGSLISISSRRVSSFPKRIHDVGVIMDLGIHEIDILNYLTGSKPVAVYSVGKRGNDGRVEHANILIKYKNNVNGHIETNWLTPMKVRRTSLTCSKCFVEVDYVSQSLKYSSSETMEFDSANMYQIPQEYNIRQVSLRKQEPLMLELQDFLTAIEKKKKPLVTGEDGMLALHVALAATESVEKGEMIKL